MMTRHATRLALPALALMLAASPAAAQDVRADVRIRTGPVTGRVVIGDDRHAPPPARVIVVDRGRERGREIVDYRGSNRIIIVDRDRGHSARAHGKHYKRHVRAYWDPRSERFYFERWRPGLREVLLCEHGNKYHLLESGRDDRWYRDDRRDHDDYRNRARPRGWN